MDSLPQGNEPLPGIDILATTDDGRRVGIDPETGEYYEEIEGGSISGTPERRKVSFPADESVNVTISAQRLRDALQSRDIEPPEEISYKRTLIVDREPSIRDDDGIPFIEGRIRQVVETTTGTDEDTVVLTGTTVDIDPDRISVKSKGDFVTAYLSFDDDIDIDSLVVESVVLDQLQAVHDEKYGFVNNPVVTHNGSPAVQVKFDRQAVIDAYEPGEHEIGVTGIIDGVSFRADTTIEVFEPGNNGSKEQNK